MIPAPYTCSPTRRISSSLYYNGFLAADINGIFPHPQTQEALYSFLVLWTWLDWEKDVSLLICCTFLYQSSLMTNVYIFSTCIYILNFFCIHADDANRDTCQCFWQKWNVVLINSFLLRNTERTKKRKITVDKLMLLIKGHLHINLVLRNSLLKRNFMWM